MKLLKLVFISAILATFSSCSLFKSQPGDKGVTEKTTTKTEDKDTKPDFVPEPAEYQPAQEKVHKLVHTKLNVSFDWENQYVIGDAELTLEPYFYDQDSVTLDAKGFDVEYVKLLKEPGEEILLSYTYDDSLQLNIALDKVYERGEQFQLHIKYTAKPNELDEGGSRAISSDKGLYFINPLGEDEDKPKQIWTQGETEASSCWFPTIDAPNQKSTQEIYITVDTSFVSLSNGTLIYSKHNGDGTRTDYWKMDQPHAPYLFMLAVGDFSVISDEWEDIMVDYYVEPEYAPHAKAVFGNTPEMLTFFSEKLDYDYPWDKYAQIVVRDFVSGAMENTTASVFMEQLQLTTRETLDKNWDYIIAHELFHHWFGDLVTCESWSNLALNESFANYSEYMWFEHKYGRAHADNHRQSEFEDYLAEAQNKQVPIIRYHYHHRMDMFDTHSYNKGGMVLHMLRKHLGDEAFFHSLQFYLEDHEFTDVEIHDLRLAFEEVTGKDLNWFFDQWFLSPGHPQLKVAHDYNEGTLTVEVEQLQDPEYTPIYKLPLGIDYWVDGKKYTKNVVIEQEKESYYWNVEKKPENVLFDTEQQLLAEVSHTKTIDEWIHQYNNNHLYQARYNALDTLFSAYQLYQIIDQNYDAEKDSYKKISELLGMEIDSATHRQMEQNAMKMKKVFRKAMNDNYHGLREMALEQITLIDYGQHTEAIEAAENLALGDSAAAVRAAAFDVLVAGAENHNAFIQTFKKGLNDSSYAVNASALLGYVKTDAGDKQEVIEKFEDASQPQIIKGVAAFYTQNEDTTKVDWMLKKYQDMGSIEKIRFAETLADYVSILSPETSKKLIDQMVDYGMNGEQKYTKFGGYKPLYLLSGYPGVDEKRKQIVENETDDFLSGIYEQREKMLDSQKGK